MNDWIKMKVWQKLFGFLFLVSEPEGGVATVSKTSVKMLERKVWGTYKDGEIQREQNVDGEESVMGDDAPGYFNSEDEETYQRLIR